MKKHGDSKAYIKQSDIQLGDMVLVKRDKSYRTSQTPYEPTPYTVIGRKGTMITATRGNKIVTRNSSFFKRIKKPEFDPRAEASSSTDDDFGDTDNEVEHEDHGNQQPPVQGPRRRYPHRPRQPPRHLIDND